MDENAYRELLAAQHQLPCVFGKALLAAQAQCDRAIRVHLAEREWVACRSAGAHDRCNDYLVALQQRARFALKLPAHRETLAHAMAMKLQCGGLSGLSRVSPVSDASVAQLMLAAQERFGWLEDWPWRDIVAVVAAWQGRRRSRESDS